MIILIYRVKVQFNTNVCLKTPRKRPGKMAEWLRVLAILVKDQSYIYSIHIRWLTNSQM